MACLTLATRKPPKSTDCVNTFPNINRNALSKVHTLNIKITINPIIYKIAI